MSLTDIKTISYEIRARIVKIMFGFTCGPLGWSVALTNNSLVIHSVDHISSLFIHLTPMLMVYNLRWNSDITLQHYPLLFSLGTMEGSLFIEIILSTFIVYFFWWIIYSFWLVNWGIHLPA